MTVKAQIIEMVNLIPDGELSTVLDVLRHFVPVGPDDIASEDDIASHIVAMAEYDAGETVPHEAINWN